MWYLSLWMGDTIGEICTEGHSAKQGGVHALFKIISITEDKGVEIDLDFKKIKESRQLNAILVP